MKCCNIFIQKPEMKMNMQTSKIFLKKKNKIHDKRLNILIFIRIYIYISICTNVSVCVSAGVCTNVCVCDYVLIQQVWMKMSNWTMTSWRF